MHMHIRTVITVVALSLLAACANPPNPTQAPTASEARTPAPTSTKQPTPQEITATASPTRPSLPDPDRLLPALEMSTGRAAHTATLLQDGRVLIAGGFREEGTSEVAIASAEIFDPSTGIFTPSGDMNEARDGHTATLLPNGQVLIVGGWNQRSRTATAELYDPSTGVFRYTGSMMAPRQGMTATLLQDGKVLIAGGDSARDMPQLIAEIYDPETDTFIQSGSLTQGRSIHTATLLDDGSVLLVGGHSSGDMVLDSAEIYHPAQGNFTITGSMSGVRYKHSAVKLPNGNVLVIGGSNQNDWQGKYRSTEMYDVRTGLFTRSADLNGERFKLTDAAVLLEDGNVLVGGGNRQIEVFDAQNQRFVLDGELDNDYYSATAIRLNNGSVMIAGGYDSNIQPSDKAWIYNLGAQVNLGSIIPVKTCAPTRDDGLSPSYQPDAPARTTVGHGHVLTGTVRSSLDCLPIADARLEFWPEYAGQGHPENARATIFTDSSGSYHFECDPPEHIHMRISAEGFRTIGQNSYHPEGEPTGTFDIVLEPEEP